ncbi:hypothetical protein WA577_005886, partial [Blastocystis sp. JDR]
MKTFGLLLAGCFLFVGCHSFGITLATGEQRCFTEHMDEHVLTKGKYILSDSPNLNQDKSRVSVTVFDPSSKVIYQATDIKKGKFLFNSPSSGTYKICFKNDNQVEVSLFFRYKFGIEAKDYSHLAQFQNLEDVEVQTQWIVDSLYEVQDTVDVIQEHDEEIRRIAMDLDNKLIVFSIITIVVLIVISIFQMYVLKRRLVKAK